MNRYIKLPNGVIVDADRIQAVVRQDVNTYAIVLHECPVTLKADVSDVEALEHFLEVEIYEAPSPLATA